MDDIIEKYYNEYNFPNVEKLYKLLVNDGYDQIKKKDVKAFFENQEQEIIFKEKKKSKKNGSYYKH